MFELEQSLELHQTLSPQQIQSLQILAYTNQELEEFLKNEYFENPLLENTIDKQGEMLQNLETLYENDEGYRREYITDDDEEEPRREIRAREGLSIRQIVLEQLVHRTDLSKREWDIIESLIQFVNEQGFLDYDPTEIALDLGFARDEVQHCLEILKGLEPAGLFASGIEECLIIQLQRQGVSDDILFSLIRDHMDEILSGRFSNASRSLRISTGQVKKYLRIISTLQPYPIMDRHTDSVEYIVPDIIIKKEKGGEWEVELNDSWMGEYRCNEYYVRMMKTTADPELKEYFEEKLRRAVFIMSCVEKRRETLVNICRAILQLQEEHFLNGAPITPMLMREVAELAGINSSTVSRAVQGKYIQYRKTGLLRDFFSGKAIEGSEVSGREIRNILADMIREEDREAPLSDMQIVNEMEKLGITISRRTVTKYRKQMGLPDSRHRI